MPARRRLRDLVIHASSWLNVDRGTGFPIYMFNDWVLYAHDSGGAPKSVAAKTWWTNWWNNAIRGEWYRWMDTSTRFPEENSEYRG